MVFKHVIDGYEKLSEFLGKHNKQEKLVLLFTGSGTSTSASWCPDCVAADPVIEKGLNEVADKAFQFAKVSVGSRAEWKDPKCPFRTDPRLKLTSVPTLLLYGTANRLNDAECQSIDNVRMILEDM